MSTEPGFLDRVVDVDEKTAVRRESAAMGTMGCILRRKSRPELLKLGNDVDPLASAGANGEKRGRDREMGEGRGVVGENEWTDKLDQKKEGGTSIQREIQFLFFSVFFFTFFNLKYR